MIPAAGALVALFEVLRVEHGAAHSGYKLGERSRLRSWYNHIEPVEMVFHIHLTRQVSTACLG
jgi:hypothetical protein